LLMFPFARMRIGVENANGMKRIRARIYTQAHTRPILSGLQTRN